MRYDEVSKAGGLTAVLLFASLTGSSPVGGGDQTPHQSGQPKSREAKSQPTSAVVTGEELSELVKRIRETIRLEVTRVVGTRARTSLRARMKHRKEPIAFKPW